MSQDNEKKKNDSRWWEFYVIRYFVGTALGAIVILFLATSTSPVTVNQGALAEILKTLKPEKFESGYLWLLLTLGLTYCYLASSPVLVLHATRGSLLSARTTINWKLVSVFGALFLLITGAQAYALFRDLRIKGDPWGMKDFYFGAGFLVLICFLFVFQILLLWLSLSGRETKAFEYYDIVVRKRAQKTAVSQEYVESYRHLREHGNAFFIALLELLLGAALFYSPVSWAVILMLWIAPAAGVWFLGTFLESRDF